MNRFDPDPRILARFGVRLPAGDLWVFGYGSLMWSPDIPHERAEPATLAGFHRSFCITSMRYRGTVECPGLVLGLDHGGDCHGMAFKVRAADVMEALEALWVREMSNDTYCPKYLPVRAGGSRMHALAFVADRRRTQYQGGLGVEETARRILAACGQRGRNIEYLENTVRHLDELGVRDARLHEVLACVRRLEGA